jgi:hypothetical protein
MYISTMIVTVRIVIADLMGQWKPYVRTHEAMTIQTVTIIVGTYKWPPLSH